ncbi:MAG: AsmA family protein [Pseudomonadales bacterium]
MNVFLKTVGYLFAVIVVLIVVLVLCLRFKPDWFLATINQVQSAAQIEADGLAVSFLPLSLSAQTIHAAMEAQDVSVTDALASINFSAWWTDKPFWQVEIEQVQVDQHRLEEASAETSAGSMINVMPYLTFSKLHIGTLTLAGAAPVQAQLTAEQSGREIELLASAQVADNLLEINGTLTRSPDSLGFQLQLASTASEPQAPKVVGELRGKLLSSERLVLNLQTGWLEIVANEETHRIDNLAGGLSVRADGGVHQLKIDDLRGEYLGPHWSEALKIAATGALAQPTTGLDVAMALTLGATAVNISTDPTSSREKWLGSIRIESGGLHSSLSTAPYQAEDVFPLKFTTDVGYSDGEVVLDSLVLETPSTALAGALTLHPEAPLKLVVDLNAERLYVPLIAANEQAPAEATPADVEDEPAEPAGSAEASADGEAPSADTEEVVFSDEPIDWTWLETAEINVSLHAEELRLQEARFNELRIKASNDASRLTIEPFSAVLGEGGFEGALTLALAPSQAPLSENNPSSNARGAEFTARFTADGVALESFGFVPQEDLKGGALELELDLRAQGNSAHALASDLSGRVLLLVQEATLMSDMIELVGSDLLMETVNKLNPFRKEDPTTELQCALVLFNAEDGVLKTNKQLVVETTKMEIIGDGNIDLAEETLDITFSPNAKSGVGLNAGTLVKFLKLGGTLANPRPAADAAGLVTSGLAIGAAISTGGASLVADGLAKRVLNAGSACEAARQEPQVPEVNQELSQ